MGAVLVQLVPPAGLVQALTVMLSR
jgi:hypothetical protein